MNPTDQWGRPTRRERRLTSFLAAQLEANEQIEFILSLAREKASEKPRWLLDPTVAIVVTNHSVFIVGLQRLTARPQTTGTATYPRDGVTAEWTSRAEYVSSAGYGGYWVGRLRITSPFGTRDVWVQGTYRQQKSAQDIAAALKSKRA